MSTDTRLVRLKPFDPRRGNLLRRFTYMGIRFVAGRGWYRVKEEVAKHLEKVRQTPDNPHAPLAFDVCTEAEAKRLDAAEKSSEAQSAEDPIDTGSASEQSEGGDAGGEASDTSTGGRGRRGRGG